MAVQFDPRVALAPPNETKGGRNYSNSKTDDPRLGLAALKKEIGTIREEGDQDNTTVPGNNPTGRPPTAEAPPAPGTTAIKPPGGEDEEDKAEKKVASRFPELNKTDNS